MYPVIALVEDPRYNANKGSTLFSIAKHLIEISYKDSFLLYHLKPNKNVDWESSLEYAQSHHSCIRTYRIDENFNKKLSFLAHLKSTLVSEYTRPRKGDASATSLNASDTQKFNCRSNDDIKAQIHSYVEGYKNRRKRDKSRLCIPTMATKEHKIILINEQSNFPMNVVYLAN